MANWTKEFTQADDVNYGREIEITDTPTTQMFNVGINNTQYLYDLLQAGFIDSIQVTNNSIVVSKKKADKTTTSLTISISDLNGYTKSEIDQTISGINDRLNELGFKYPTASQTFTLAVGGSNILNISVSAGASGDRTKTSREGNRTLLKFGVSFISGYYTNTNFSNFYTNGYTATSSQVLPELYRPKEEQVFYVNTRVEYRYTYQSTTYVSTIYLPIKITLGTNGVFSAQVPTTMKPSFPSQLSLSYYQNYSYSLSSMSIGYPNNPTN